MRTVIKEVANCGTYGGYQTHIRLGIKPCGPCKTANSGYMRERRRMRGETKSTLVPLSAECPNCGHHINEEAA